MEQQKDRFRSTDEYIATFPEDIQAKLQALRATIRAAAPDATELISYNMPAFAQHGNLVYFAAAKKYIGLYPTSSATAAFQQELSQYEGSRGSVHFPFDQPLPMDLITRIVQFRVAENLEREAAKAEKQAAKKASSKKDVTAQVGRRDWARCSASPVPTWRTPSLSACGGRPRRRRD